MVRDILFLLSVCTMFAVVIVMSIYNIVWHFQYPDATETRLFLMFWENYVGMFVIFVIAMIVYGKTK